MCGCEDTSTGHQSQSALMLTSAAVCGSCGEATVVNKLGTLNRASQDILGYNPTKDLLAILYIQAQAKAN